MLKRLGLITAFLLIIPTTASATTVTFNGDEVRVNGVPTNDGGQAEGLLLNARMVHAAVHDYNTRTQDTWAYPGGDWSASRNVNEFIDALPTYAGYGLDMVTVSMMGGHPRWKCADDGRIGGRDFSSFTREGVLRDDAKARFAEVIRAADREGIIVNVQYFYRTADKHMGPAAILRAVDEATLFLKGLGTGNILIEVANELSDGNYDGNLDPTNIDDRIREVRQIWPGALVTASLHAGAAYPANLVGLVDWVSLHTNPMNANEVTKYVARFRSMDVPIVITEGLWDGEADMRAAVDAGAGFGFYNQGCEQTGRYAGSSAYYSHGYQSLPVNWDVNTSSKRTFFELVEDFDS